MSHEAFFREVGEPKFRSNHITAEQAAENERRNPSIKYEYLCCGTNSSGDVCHAMLFLGSKTIGNKKKPYFTETRDPRSSNRHINGCSNNDPATHHSISELSFDPEMQPNPIDFIKWLESTGPSCLAPSTESTQEVFEEPGSIYVKEENSFIVISDDVKEAQTASVSDTDSKNTDSEGIVRQSNSLPDKLYFHKPVDLDELYLQNLKIARGFQKAFTFNNRFDIPSDFFIQPDNYKDFRSGEKKLDGHFVVVVQTFQKGLNSIIGKIKELGCSRYCLILREAFKPETGKNTVYFVLNFDAPTQRSDQRQAMIDLEKKTVSTLRIDIGSERKRVHPFFIIGAEWKDLGTFELDFSESTERFFQNSKTVASDCIKIQFPAFSLSLLAGGKSS